MRFCLNSSESGSEKRMKRKWLAAVILVAAIFMSWAEASAEVGGEKLSFADAVAKALMDNPDIRFAEAGVEGQKALKQKTMAAYMPVVDLYTDYVKGDSPSGALFTSIDQRKLQPNTDFNNPGDFENFESGVKAHMMLFNGGRNILGGKAASDMLQAGIAGKKAVVNQVVADVMKSWFNVLSAQRFLKISEETVETIKKQLEIMSVRYKGGGVLKSDILALKVRLAEAEEELIRNKSRNLLSGASLAILLGLSPETDVMIDTDQTVFKRFEEAVMKIHKGGGAIRPEMLQAEKMVSGAEKSAGIAKRNYLPTVNLMGKYYVDDNSMDYSTDRENWTVGVMMNWNLFSGLSNLADKRKAVSDLTAAREAKRKAGLSVAMDAKRAFLMLEEAGARLKVSDKNRELAEESLMLVKKQYEGGAATITRYLDAELAFSKAKNRLATAQCDRMSAVAETARAKGLLADPVFLINGRGDEPGAPKEMESKPDETE